MNKNSIILLILVTSAHVHGAPNLRPRQSQPEPGKNTKHAIQKKTKPIQKKTNQRGVAQIDTSSKKNDDAQDNPLSAQSVSEENTLNNQNLNQEPVSQALYDSELPQKYCEQEKKWVEWGGEADDCVWYNPSTLTIHVPNRHDVIQKLNGINFLTFVNQQVQHIVFDVPYVNQHEWTSIITPHEADIINNLFTGQENNSITFRSSHARWEIDAPTVLHLSNVKHLMFQGKTGNENLEVKVLDAMDNKCVTVCNANTLNLSNHHRSTKAHGTNAKVTLKEDGTIHGTGDTNVWHAKYDKDKSLCQEVSVEGPNAQLIVAKDGTIHGAGDKQVWYARFNAHGFLCQCIKAKSITNAKVILKEDGTLHGAGDINVFHEIYNEDRSLCHQAKAEGPNAQLIVAKDGTIMEKSGTKMWQQERDNDQDLCQLFTDFRPIQFRIITEEQHD